MAISYSAKINSKSLSAFLDEEEERASDGE